MEPQIQPIDTFGKDPSLSPEIQNTVTSILSLKKQNRFLCLDTLSKMRSNSRKEQLILSLKRDLDYYTKEVTKRENNLAVISQKRFEAEENKNEVELYCAQLREQLKDFVDQVDYYESEITKLNEQRLTMATSSTALKEYKREEKLKLENQLKEMQDKIDTQISKINLIETQFNDHIELRDKEKRNLIEQENKDVEKHNFLFKKYREMLSKYNVYEQEEDNQEINDIHAVRKEYETNLAKEELNIKITEARLKNEILQKELHEITTKYNNYAQIKAQRDKMRLQNNLAAAFKKKTLNTNTNTNTNNNSHNNITSQTHNNIPSEPNDNNSLVYSKVISAYNN
jgi:chromosome segregation ATPase